MDKNLKKINSMIDPKCLAFRFVAILYEQGEINAETWKKVKDLERQEIANRHP